MAGIPKEHESKIAAAYAKKRDFPTLVIRSTDGHVVYSHTGTGTNYDKIFADFASFNESPLAATLMDSLSDMDKDRLRNWLELLYDEVYVELMLHEDIMKMCPSFSLTWTNGANYEVRFETIKTEKIYEYVLVWLEAHRETSQQKLAAKIIELLRQLRQLPNEVINNLMDYLPEVKEHLDMANYAEAKTRADIIEPLQRHLHAAKGTIFFLGLSTLGEAFHEAESNLEDRASSWTVSDGIAPIQDAFSQLNLLITLTEGIITRVYKASEQEEEGEMMTVPLKEFYQLLDHSIDLNRRLRAEKTLPSDLRDLSEKVHHGLVRFDAVPLTTLLERLATSTNQLSRELQKAADFSAEMEVGRVDLPNRFFDSLWNALYQVLKNGIDHGIEPTDLRREQGKPATAQIAIRIWSEEGRLFFALRDDGRGMDPENIALRAVARGLLAEEEAHRLIAAGDSGPIFDLIFLPGFTTQENVTTISGRGVGTDVIKKEVEFFKGSISMSSVKGENTIFTLSFPIFENHIVMED